MAEEVLHETYDPSLTILDNHGYDIILFYHIRTRKYRSVVSGAKIGAECNIETRERLESVTIIAAREIAVHFSHMYRF